MTFDSIQKPVPVTNITGGLCEQSLYSLNPPNMFAYQ